MQSTVGHALFTFIVLFVSLSVNTGAQVSWTRDPANPVLDMWTGAPNDPNAYNKLYTVGVYADSIAPDGKNIPYRMWFGSRSAAGEPGYSISYAISPDKSDWYFSAHNPVLTTGPDGSFDDVWVLDPDVIFDGTNFRMYYSAFNGEKYFIGLATSADGIHWTKSASNPVLAPSAGAWDAAATTSAEVYFDGVTYHMIYTGFDGSTYAIGAATSPDGVTWTKNILNPVIAKGVDGSWEDQGALACAMTVHDGIYYLFYQGRLFNDLGLATSTDGVSWAKYGGNPLFGHTGSFENGIAYGAVTVKDGYFELWYSGLAGAEQIGHASSPMIPLAVAPQEVPVEYALAQNYPNPFNPSTTITYQLKQRSRVELRLYNALGAEVAFLVNGTEEQGPHTVRWSADGVASGSYFYRLIVTDLANLSNAYTVVGKMLLIR